MQFSSVKLNFADFDNIILEYNIIGSLQEGMNIHQGVVKNGF